MYKHVEVEHVNWRSIGAVAYLNCVFIPGFSKKCQVLVDCGEEKEVEKPDMVPIVDIQAMVKL